MTTRAGMVAQYGAEGRERQGEQHHTIITELRAHYFNYGMSNCQCPRRSGRVRAEVR